MLLELRDIVMGSQRALLVMIAFIALDIVSGIIKAVIERELNSTKLKDGIYHKVLEIILVIVGVLLDFMLETNYIANAVLIALVGMEGISILENIGSYIPLPAVLKEVLAKLNGEE